MPSSPPPIFWHQWSDGTSHFASLNPDGSRPFAVVGECVGRFAGLYSVRIIRTGAADLFGKAGSLEQARRFVERWTSVHWRAVLAASTEPVRPLWQDRAS